MIRRIPRTVALAVIIAIGIFNVYMAVTHWTLSDAGAYWEAALRLRSGGELYPERRSPCGRWCAIAPGSWWRSSHRSWLASAPSETSTR
jgi:hypothetical protein